FEIADLLDRDLHLIAALQELAALGADARGRSGQHHIARIERDARREMRDLLGGGEDHPARVRILLDRAIDPELDRKRLRIADLLGRNEPWPQGTGAVEIFLADPVVFEGRLEGDV